MTVEASRAAARQLFGLGAAQHLPPIPLLTRRPPNPSVIFLRSSAVCQEACLSDTERVLTRQRALLLHCTSTSPAGLAPRVPTPSPPLGAQMSMQEELVGPKAVAARGGAGASRAKVGGRGQQR